MSAHLAGGRLARDGGGGLCWGRELRLGGCRAILGRGFWQRDPLRGRCTHGPYAGSYQTTALPLHPSTYPCRPSTTSPQPERVGTCEQERRTPNGHRKCVRLCGSHNGAVEGERVGRVSPGDSGRPMGVTSHFRRAVGRGKPIATLRQQVGSLMVRDLLHALWQLTGPCQMSRMSSGDVIAKDRYGAIKQPCPSPGLAA